MYPTKPLGDKNIFNIIGSGIELFKGEKKYYSTSSIQLNKICKPESIITFNNRQSRANMQFQKGTVIFAKMKETNKVLIINEELEQNAIFSTGFAGIKGNDNLVFSGYLFYYFISAIFNKIKDDLSSGVTQVAINNSGISNIQIPLPPLSTQKLIVQKLDSAFENIDKNINLTKENLKNLEELNKSVLEKVFSEGEYEKVDLIKIASFSNKTTLPKDGDLYNYIGLENIESNTGKLVNFKETLGKEIRSNKVIFKNGMVLYGKLRPYLNKVIVSEFDGVATTEILPIECTDKLYNYYLGYFLRTDYFVNLANINISGARMPRVTTKFLKEEIQIPLPPLQKQKEIVSYLDEVFAKNKELKTKYELQLKELEELKQSLLKDAFEGRLVKE